MEETTNEHDAGRDLKIYVLLGIPLNSFRIFGFLDDTGFQTTIPGVEARRTHGIHDDIQRAIGLCHTVHQYMHIINAQDY